MDPGDLIHGRFLLERFVARGGMGEVFRAIDQNTQQPVALKLVDSGDAKLAERFQDMFANMAGLGTGRAKK